MPAEPYTPGRFAMVLTDARGARDTIALTSQVKIMRDGMERALGRRPALILVVVDEPERRAAEQLIKAALEPAETSPLDAAYRNVERAARELDALFDGNVGGWKLDGRAVTGEASHALLSLHDYLNDVTNAVGVAPSDRRCARLLVGRGDDTYDPECVLPLGHPGPCSPTEVSDAG